MTETHLETGIVASVDEVPNGDELAADAAPGATTLTLYDACDFNEDGGTARLVGDGVPDEVTAYTSADLDLDVLVLAAPLVGSWPADTPIRVEPDSRERRAFVQLDADGEGVDARVPHALYDRLVEGTRDEVTGERVTLTLDGAEWVVADVLSRVPAIDGSFIDPETLPPSTVTTDGDAPATSPTPTVIGGIGAVFARWTAPANDDPVTYEVHISPTSGFTPGPATLVVTTPATSVTVRKLPTPVGTPPSDVLVYDIPYYVRIIARDADGPGPVGAQGSAAMVRVTGPDDIAVDSIYTRHIVASQITGELLSADVILGSRISTGSIDRDPSSPTFEQIIGQRVEMDPGGLRVVTADGVPIVSLPTDPGQDARFEGQIVARALTVTGGASFQSTANYVANDAGFTLATGVAEPTLAPTAATNYDTVPLQISSRTDQLGTFALTPSQITCMCPSPTAGFAYVVQDRTDGSRVWCYRMSDGANVTDGVLGTQFDYAGMHVVGITVLAGRRVVLARSQATPTDAFYYFHDAARTNRRSYDYFPGINNTQDPALGNDGTSLIVAENDKATTSLVRRTMSAWSDVAPDWPPGGLPITATVTFATGTRTAQSLCFAARGNFDFSVNRFVVAGRGVSFPYYVLDPVAGSAWDTTRGWPSGTSNRRGAMWDAASAAFYEVGSDGVLRRFVNYYPPDGTTLWAGYTWWDSIGITHESKISPVSKAARARRARMMVTLPPLPFDVTGADDPNGIRLYARDGIGSTQPALWLQRTLLPSPGQSVTIVLDSLTTGPVPPTTNTFPTGVPGYFRSQASRLDGNPKAFVDGSGKANFDGLVPPGAIILHAGQTAPEGWLLCNGDAVYRVLYPDLFAAIGLTYTAGSDPQTFNLPNLKGSVPVGLDAAQGEFNSLGKTGGEKYHALTYAEMPRHTHPLSDVGAAKLASSATSSFRTAVATGFESYLTAYQWAATRTDTAVSHTTGVGLMGRTNTDSSAFSADGTAHNTLQPFLVLQYIIKT